MKLSEIIADIENINPKVFFGTFSIRKAGKGEPRVFHEIATVLRYSPSGLTVHVSYAGKNAAPWMPAVIIDIIDGV